MMHAPALEHHTTTPDTPLGDSPSTRPRRSPLGKHGTVYVPLDLLEARIAAPLFALWVILAAHIRRDHLDAFPSRTTIGHALGRAPRSVSTLIAQLEAAGWLHVNRLRAYRYSRNFYRPGGTITTGTHQQHAAVSRAELDALAAGDINPSAFRDAARWRYRMGPAGWTADTLPEFAARYGVSLSTAEKNRRALVAAGLLETRTDERDRTITGRPEHLSTARRSTEQDPVKNGTPSPYETAPHPRKKRHTEVVTPEVVTPEVVACGPARRARTGPNVRAAATTTPPAPRAEKMIEGQKPEPVGELVDGSDRDEKRSDETRTEQQARTAAGVLLARFPDGYDQQEQPYRLATFRRLSCVLADGYGPEALPLGPEAILAAVWRHDRPEHNPTRTLDRALRELAADVLAGACPECGRDPDALRPICDRCNPDRDTLTGLELAALAAAGYDLEATA